MLVSPFITVSASSQILSSVQKRHAQDRLGIVVLTDLRPESALSGSTDLEALVQLSRAVSQFDLVHLPSLHAKVYVADQTMAIITSGNLTDSGLEANIEYGIVSTDEGIVREIRTDFERYATLGAKVAPRDVATLIGDVEELEQLYGKAQKSIRARARRVFQEKLDAARIRILRHRAKGKSTHAILADTILFLLSKGPLRTVELHPMIQHLHPDICDDSVDRVLDGVHFGKKWKHHVRTAQQFLKREGRIRYDGQRWHLAL